MASICQRLRHIMVRAYEVLADWLVYIGAALILFMMLSISASVLFRRTAFNFGWALEVSEYILIIATLFGSAWLLKKGGHVRVDVLSIYLHGRIKVLYSALVFGLVALVCLGFTVIGIQTTIETYISGTLEIKVYLEFRKWILIALFPLAGLMMSIEAGRLSIKHFIEYVSKKND